MNGENYAFYPACLKYNSIPLVAINTALCTYNSISVLSSCSVTNAKECNLDESVVFGNWVGWLDMLCIDSVNQP